MAIIKDLNSSFGIVANYHRVTSISVNYKNKKVIICVASYASKVARASNYNPLEEIDIEVPKEDYSLFIDTNGIEKAYLWLKDNVVCYENATDDYDSFGDNVQDEVNKDKAEEVINE